MRRNRWAVRDRERGVLPARLALGLVIGALCSAAGCGSSPAHGDPAAVHAGGTDASVSADASNDSDASVPFATMDAEGTDAGSDGPLAPDVEAGAPAFVDPGTGPWVTVPSDQVRSVCGLDPDKLAAADTALAVPWAIVRHGRMCHSFMADGMQPEEAWSTTKTLGAVVAGAVAYQTASVAPSGPMTGPFSDLDRVDKWLTSFSYNPDAHVAHVMAMVAQNADLSLGHKTMQYDIIGTTQINSLSDILNAVVKQDTARLGTDLEQFTQRFVFAPLGMTQSTWSGGSATKIFAYSWSTTVFDMARVGLLMLDRGIWSGQRVVDEGWIYRMTHPAFEDANTGYGYLTWLNASINHNFGGIPISASGWDGNQTAARSPGPCAPVSVYPEHPHGLSDSPDCNYSAPYTCSQPYDVGVWNAVGLLGQNIQGHPGLDLVIVVKDLTPNDTGPTSPGILWDAVRPAVIAADPKFAGDEQGFCTAYGGNAYAPDLR
jgi:hypothetical protein